MAFSLEHDDTAMECSEQAHDHRPCLGAANQSSAVVAAASHLRKKMLDFSPFSLRTCEHLQGTDIGKGAASCETMADIAPCTPCPSLSRQWSQVQTPSLDLGLGLSDCQQLQCRKRPLESEIIYSPTHYTHQVPTDSPEFLFTTPAHLCKDESDMQGGALEHDKHLKHKASLLNSQVPHPFLLLGESFRLEESPASSRISSLVEASICGETIIDRPLPESNSCSQVFLDGSSEFQCMPNYEPFGKASESQNTSPCDSANISGGDAGVSLCCEHAGFVEVKVEVGSEVFNCGQSTLIDDISEGRRIARGKFLSLSDVHLGDNSLFSNSSLDCPDMHLPRYLPSVMPIEGDAGLALMKTSVCVQMPQVLSPNEESQVLMGTNEQTTLTSRTSQRDGNWGKFLALSATVAPPGKANILPFQHRFKQLQDYLKQCDTSDKYSLQAFRSLSTAAISDYAVELETRSASLSLQEGKELKRMKLMNKLWE